MVIKSKHTEESKRKVSLAIKRRWDSGLGTGFKIGNTVNNGKKYSKERVEKVASKNRGKKRSIEQRLRMSTSHQPAINEELRRKRLSVTLRRVVKRGADSHAWRGGVTAPNKLARKRIEYKVWDRQVFERDNFRCQHCCQKGGELNAHHIEPFATVFNKRYEVGNGITLCSTCHRRLHKINRLYKIPINALYISQSL